MPAPDGGMAVDPLPGGQEARQLPRLGGLDLLAQDGQRGAAQAAQHLGVTPLALGAAGAQLAADQVAGALELAQRRGGVDPVARAHVGGGERAVGGGVAAQQPAQRVGHVLQERRRQPARGRGAQRVAVQARVGGVDPALLAVDAHPGGAALAAQVGEHRRGIQPLEHARGHLVQRQVADAAQHVEQAVAVGGARRLRQALQVGLDALQRARVDQIAQLLLAQQLAQQVAVQRQRRRAALGVGRVALVHVGGDVVEQQRGGERRRGRGLDLHQRDLAAVQPGEQLHQPGHVEHVAQALAIGLQDDRELAVLLGHLQQRLGLQPLLPQRRALARARPRDQQRAPRVLAEAGAEQRRGAELGDDQVLDLVGLEQDQIGARAAPRRRAGGR